MHPRWLALCSIAFLTLVVFVLFAFRLRPVWTPEDLKAKQDAEETLTEPTVTYVNPKKGAAEPEIVLVEFADFQCSACKEFAETLDVLLRTIPEAQVVWKNMPNESIHELATPAAIAAHCAGEQGKFWEYHDVLFDRQVVLTEPLFAQIATELSLDEDEFKRCYNNRDTLPLIKKDFEEALALGIPATPALYIGNEPYIGALDINQLVGIVRQKLAQ